jgi:hypothetical protein
MEKLAIDEKTKQILEESRKIHGVLSIAFIMRKLKCSASTACEIYERIARHT